MTAAFVTAWLMQGLVLAALLAGTAALLQRIARDALPARAIWAAALAGTTVLTFLAPFRLAAPSAESLGSRVGATHPVRAHELGTPIAAFVSRAMEGVGALLEAPVTAIAHAAAPLPAAAGYGALMAWALVTGALLLSYVVGHRRLRRLLAAAESRRIAGVPVRLTADIGPAAVGVRAPVIAVPRWLLHLPTTEQSLVVRHEQAHLVARDPLLLIGGVGLAALQPWNPFAWLMLSRLRLAIELDCDRRLLREGTSPRAYGDLLIALAAAASPAIRPATLYPVFSIHRSHLAQRIIAMTARPVQSISARRVAAAIVAGVVAIAACESRLPTDAEGAARDAATVEGMVVPDQPRDQRTMRTQLDGGQASAVQGVEGRKGVVTQDFVTTTDSGRFVMRPDAGPYMVPDGVDAPRRTIQGDR